MVLEYFWINDVCVFVVTDIQSFWGSFNIFLKQVSCFFFLPLATCGANAIKKVDGRKNGAELRTVITE